MKPLPLSIEAFAQQIPSALAQRSGKAFYSGRSAFSTPGPLYVLGVNPGGDPTKSTASSIEEHTRKVLDVCLTDWSAYRDESWNGSPPGTHGMAPRVLHMFDVLKLNPGSIPCSNLVFVRSQREANIGTEFQALADQCWGFHAFAIEHLRPRVILCFGRTAGHYVRHKLDAHRILDELIETNNRRWRSQTFSGRNGIKVIVATHPSIADWTTAATDPTPLVQRALQ